MIAKLAFLGIPPERVARMTLRQVHFVMRAIGDDMKFKVRLAGRDVPDEDKEATLQDLLGFGM
ncbi:hypothetical protein [Alicyclobacillus contaminans]|uniref:hypothetical protein n=1 Tax=Alicyclobacillus contaminans TaxID=392016 RepID=UPI00042991A8|nr:hypothetical protein [Alicyclobacillus contaminans]